MTDANKKNSHRRLGLSVFAFVLLLGAGSMLYRKWKFPAEPPFDPARAEKLFYSCKPCHTVDGAPGVGPTLKGLYRSRVRLENGSDVVADESYLRESILRPDAKIRVGYEPGSMNSFRGQLSDEEVDILIQYIRTLRAPKN